MPCFSSASPAVLKNKWFSRGWLCHVPGVAQESGNHPWSKAPAGVAPGDGAYQVHCLGLMGQVTGALFR